MAHQLPFTYVRWKADMPREGAVFPPLDPPHPMYRQPCVLCPEQLGNGCRVQLLAIGPDDDDTRQRHITGRWYSALAVVVHAWHLNPEEDPPAEQPRVEEEVRAS